MNRAAIATLSLPERLLIEQTEPKALAALDEDEAGDLLLQVRRARNKYSKLYRRQAGAQVATDASRAKASAKNQRTRDKAEVFEDALARVSRRLAALARESAAELRTERLAAARGARALRGVRRPVDGRRGDGAVGDVGRSGGKTPASRKRTASTQGDGRPPSGQARQPLSRGSPIRTGRSPTLASWSLARRGRWR